MDKVPYVETALLWPSNASSPWTKCASSPRGSFESFRNVQVSVAMGNAGAKVKAAAGHVAPSNDQDGAAVAIRTLLSGGFD